MLLYDDTVILPSQANDNKYLRYRYKDHVIFLFLSTGKYQFLIQNRVYTFDIFQHENRIYSLYHKQKQIIYNFTM